MQIVENKIMVKNFPSKYMMPCHQVKVMCHEFLHADTEFNPFSNGS